MITTISTLPTPPNRNEPQTFSDQADALLNSLPGMVTQLNNFAAEVNSLTFKTACDVATTANITLSGLQTIDGVSVLAGYRVLVKDQTTQSQNGIYTAVSGAWSRAPDMDTSAEVSGAFVPVTFGTLNGGKIFYTTFNASTGTLGTTNLVFESLASGSVIGVLPVNKGGTNIASYAVGDILYASGATTLTPLAAGAAGNVLKSGTAPSWGKVALASDVSGTLPVANGGTGAATLTGYVRGNGTGAMTASGTVPVGDISGTLPVASGGTGTTSLTANNVLLGNGTSAPQTVAPGASGNVLTSNGTTWASAAPPAAGVTSVNGLTGAVSMTALGDIGSYAVLMIATNTNVAVGSTVAGSDLRHSWTPNVGTVSATSGGWSLFGANRSRLSSVYDGGGTSMTGTWRKMSTGATYGTVTDCTGTIVYWMAALYVRIS